VSAERHRAILAALQRRREVDVAALARDLGVSDMTIRRDLAALDRGGQLHRVHGGAVPRRAPAHASRATTMAGAKARIADTVVGLLGPGTAVGIDTGTTCHAVAVALARAEPADAEGLTVVTASLHVAVELGDFPGRVVVPGGTLTPELSLVRTFAEPPAVHLDVLVLGCGGLSAQRGVTYFDPAEVEVRRALAGVADRVVLAADHTKFERRKAMVLGDLDLLDVLVTDREPPAALRSALDDAGVTLRVT
jgi:DeoR/GlpR family transcriptional regulator of sugar metabolism